VKKEIKRLDFNFFRFNNEKVGEDSLRETPEYVTLSLVLFFLAFNKRYSNTDFFG